MNIQAELMIQCPTKGLVKAGHTFESTCKGCSHFVTRCNEHIRCDFDEQVPKQFVVNIFGGPDAGKTTNMLLVAGWLKRQQVKVEFSDEWIKSKVYEKSPYPFKDQIYTFAKQRKKLMERLDEKRLNVVITDSPLLLSAVYLGKPDTLLEELIVREFNSTNNINIYLERPEERSYDPVGRLQDEKGAKEIDATIKQYLNEKQIPYYMISSEEGSEEIIYELIMKYITKTQEAKVC